MPTGYTAMLEEKKPISTKKWIMEGLSRAFSITLKEHSMKLTEKQIKKQITEYDRDSMKYHIKRLNKSLKEQDRLTKLTDDEWKTEWEEHCDKIAKGNARRFKKARWIAGRHGKAYEGLRKIVDSPIAGEHLKATAEYGLQQLDLVKRDHEPWIDKPWTFEEFKKSRLHQVTWSINYHRKEYDEAEERAKYRYTNYANLRKELNQIL